MTSPVALITGGTRGLGATLVSRFWNEGYSLGISARQESHINQIIESLPKRSGQQAFAFACDMAKPEEVQQFVDQVKLRFSSLKVLVNNAAIQGPIGPLSGNDFKLWEETLQVNLLAPVAICHGLVPFLKKSHLDTSIINLSGGGATGPRANFSAYATAKAGLVRFSETLAEELKSDSIRVNCIAPGAMKTDMLGEVLSNGESAAGNREFSIANKVFEEGGASMDRVADLLVFLASDQSRGITGKLISAVWDDWEHWPDHLEELASSDVYTLRRIAGRDRGLNWGDK
jgi:NAD(P)-dependent dehydrogenase (short-subunit alcohol dehydrogenase family)